METLSPVPVTPVPVRSVLLIEDDPVTRQITHATVSALNNVEVDATDSAESAMGMLERNAYDLIILDIQLPGMDGNDFHEVIHSKGRAVPPILVITGRFTEDCSPSLLFGDNVVAILQKPLTPQMIQNFVKSVLDAPPRISS